MERFAGNRARASSGTRHTPRRLCRGRDAANGPCHRKRLNLWRGSEAVFKDRDIGFLDGWRIVPVAEVVSNGGLVLSKENDGARCQKQL